MGSAVLALPLINRLVFARVACKEGKVVIPHTSSVMRCFTQHLDGDDEKPTYIRTYAAENDSGGFMKHVKKKIEDNWETWAMDWKLEVPDGGNKNIFEYTEVRTDRDIACLILTLLREIFTEYELNIEVDSKLGRGKTVLSGENVNEVKTALDLMDTPTVIALELVAHSADVQTLIESRGFVLLKTTKKNLNFSEHSLKVARTQLGEMEKRAQTAEKLVDEREEELREIDVYLWKEGPEVFTKVLEEDGYVLPRRRLCKLCKDKKPHVEPTVSVEEIDSPGNIEERCPYFKRDQRCEQCAQFPPLCYMNDMVLECEFVETDRCTKEHYGRIPEHVSRLHYLDGTEDRVLIQKLVNKYGLCNFAEYESKILETIEVQDDM